MADMADQEASPGDQNNATNEGSNSSCEPVSGLKKRRKSGPKKRGRVRALIRRKSHRSKQNYAKNDDTLLSDVQDDMRLEVTADSSGEVEHDDSSQLSVAHSMLSLALGDHDYTVLQGPNIPMAAPLDHPSSVVGQDSLVGGSRDVTEDAFVSTVVRSPVQTSPTDLTLLPSDDVPKGKYPAHEDETTHSSATHDRCVSTQTYPMHYAEISPAHLEEKTTQTSPFLRGEGSRNMYDPSEMGSSIEGVMKKLNRSLPLTWITYERKGDICAMMMSSSGFPFTVQRSVCASLDGGRPKVFVHYVEVTEESLLQDIGCDLLPNSEYQEEFVEAFLEVVNKVRRFSICCGADEYRRFGDTWNSLEAAEVDRNRFRELRYSETLRSASCAYLVPQKKRICDSCRKLTDILRHKLKRRQSSEGRPVGPIRHLTPRRLKAGLILKQKALEASRQKNRRVMERVEKFFNVPRRNRSGYET